MAHKNEKNWSPFKSKRSRGNIHKKPEKIFSLQEANDRLYDIFQNHGMSHISHEHRMELTKFYRLLMENQKTQNFTRLVNLRDIAIKHFIDSLIVNDLTKLTYPLLDMGTGPGFPGIPLRIITPDENKIMLGEGVQKRVNFLKNVRDELELKNLDIFGRNINQEFEYPVQGVITRAVEEVQNTLANVLYCVQTGGKVFLMKGPGCEPEIAPALDKWGKYYTLSEDIKYDIPKTPHQRRLLVFEKIAPAPLRGEGK